jgi:hypothetical protein
MHLIIDDHSSNRESLRDEDFLNPRAQQHVMAANPAYNRIGYLTQAGRGFRFGEILPWGGAERLCLSTV